MFFPEKRNRILSILLLLLALGLGTVGVLLFVAGPALPGLNQKLNVNQRAGLSEALKQFKSFSGKTPVKEKMAPGLENQEKLKNKTGNKKP